VLLLARKKFMASGGATRGWVKLAPSGHDQAVTSALSHGGLNRLLQQIMIMVVL
jgi:hypothetical protein